METVNKKVIIIALIMALFTTSLIYFYIKNSNSSSNESKQFSVYVANKTLQARQKISEADIKQIKVSKESLNQNAIQNKTDIIGKRLKDSIIEGEQILKERLVSDSKYSLAYNIPKGKRAVSININEQVGMAYLVRPGDFVDVLASFEKEEITDGVNKILKVRTSKVAIQNVQVLALGQNMDVPSEKMKDPPKTITLAVNPQDVEKLVFASEFGNVRLSLRAIDEDQILTTVGTIRTDISAR